MSKLQDQQRIAKAGLLTRFASDVPCKLGHIGERMTATTMCAVCHRESGRKSDSKRMRDPAERSRATAKHYVTKGKRRQQAWVESNLEHASLVKRRWAQNNPEKVRQASRLGNARRRATAGARPTWQQVEGLFKSQRGLCVYCACSLADGYEIDHIQAVVNGGTNAITNLQLTCMLCNRRKGAKDPIAFAQSLGRLL